MRPELVVIIFILGYVIGSFPTAYLVARSKGINIFAVGSGNMGANNVFRAIGLQYGLLVWLIDGAKGAIAIILARWIAGGDHIAAASVLAALGAVTGHNWSFVATLITGSIRGGKGAATASGTLILLAPTLLLALVLMIGTAIALLTRYISLGVLVAMAVAGLGFLILVLVGFLEPIHILYLLVVWMVFVRHRANITRLLTGTERRMGEHS